MMFKHLPFQCACNDNEILASYAKGYYNFYEVEKVEIFVIFKGAYEIAGYIQNDDAPCRTENYAIFGYCLDRMLSRGGKVCCWSESCAPIIISKRCR